MNETVNHWIFVISDSDEEFHSRVTSKKWPMFTKTTNKKIFATGDPVIFYKAGENGQKFIGNATIKEKNDKEDNLGCFIEMLTISVWEKPVEMRQVLAKMDFIQNKDSWGNYFRVEAVGISEKDYLEIVSQSQII